MRRSFLVVLMVGVAALLLLATGREAVYSASPAFDAQVTRMEAFTKLKEPAANAPNNAIGQGPFDGSGGHIVFATFEGVPRYLLVEGDVVNGDEADDINVAFVAEVKADCAASLWAPLPGDIRTDVVQPGGDKILVLRTTVSMAADEARTLSRFLVVECVDSDPFPQANDLAFNGTQIVTNSEPDDDEPIFLAVSANPATATDIDGSNNQAQNTINQDLAAGGDTAAPLDSDALDGPLVNENVLPDEDDVCPNDAGTPDEFIPSTDDDDSTDAPFGIPDPYDWTGCPLSDLGLDPLPLKGTEIFDIGPPAEIYNNGEDPSIVPVFFDVENFGPDGTVFGVDMVLFAKSTLPCIVDWIALPFDSEVNDFLGSEFTALLEFKVLDDAFTSGSTPTNIGVDVQLSDVLGGAGNDPLFRNLLVICTEPVTSHPILVEVGTIPQAPGVEKQTSDDKTTGPGDDCVDNDGDLVGDAPPTGSNKVCNESNKHEQTMTVNPTLDPWKKHLIKADQTSGLILEDSDGDGDEEFSLPVGVDDALIIADVIRNNGEGTLLDPIDVENRFRSTPTPTCSGSGTSWTCEILQQVEGDALALILRFSDEILDVTSVSVPDWGYVIHADGEFEWPDGQTDSDFLGDPVAPPHGANQPSSCDGQDGDAGGGNDGDQIADDAEVILANGDYLQFFQFPPDAGDPVAKHTTVTVSVTTCEPVDSLTMDGVWTDDAFAQLEPAILGCFDPQDDIDATMDCTFITDQFGDVETMGTNNPMPANFQEKLEKTLHLECQQVGIFFIEIEDEIDFGSVNVLIDDPGSQDPTDFISVPAELLGLSDANPDNNKLTNLLQINCGGVTFDYDPWLKHLAKIDPDTLLPIDEPLEVAVEDVIQVDVIDTIRNNSTDTDIDDLEFTNTFVTIPTSCTGSGADWTCTTVNQVETVAGIGSYLYQAYFELTDSTSVPVLDVSSVSIPTWGYMIHQSVDDGDFSDTADDIPANLPAVFDNPPDSIHGANQPSSCDADDDAVLLGHNLLLELGAIPQDENTVLESVQKHTVLTFDVTLCDPVPDGESLVLDVRSGDDVNGVADFELDPLSTTLDDEEHSIWLGDFDLSNLLFEFDEEMPTSVQACWDGDPDNDNDTQNCTLPGVINAGEQDVITQTESFDAVGPLVPNTQQDFQKELFIECLQAGTFETEVLAELTDHAPNWDPVLTGDINVANNSAINNLTIVCDVEHEILVQPPIVLGPAPVNLSDTQGKFMWVIGFVDNVDIPLDQDLPEVVTVSLTVDGLPAGCDQVQTRILPPVSTLSINEGEKKPVLFRVNIVCHDPAAPDVYQLDVTVSAALASGEDDNDPSDNSQTVTKALIVVQP